MDDDSLIKQTTNRLLEGIAQLITSSKQKVAVSLNAEITMLYWSIGEFINNELRSEDTSGYGKQILATLSQDLTKKFGKGYSYSALTRMSKISTMVHKENIATLSQQLSWSHFIELSSINDDTKRLFYTSFCH